LWCKFFLADFRGIGDDRCTWTAFFGIRVLFGRISLVGLKGLGIAARLAISLRPVPDTPLVLLFIFLTPMVDMDYAGPVPTTKSPSLE
jgi:hypothetical protein